jgi:hypothetical protein
VFTCAPFCAPRIVPAERSVADYGVERWIRQADRRAIVLRIQRDPALQASARRAAGAFLEDQVIGHIRDASLSCTSIEIRWICRSGSQFGERAMSRFGLSSTASGELPIGQRSTCAPDNR